MNKTELISAVAERAGLSKKDSEKAVNALVDTVVDTLKAGEKVQMIGFGTFEVRERAARIGRDPRTGGELHIEAARLPQFKAGKALKDAIDG